MNRLTPLLPLLCLFFAASLCLQAKQRWFRMQTQHCDIYSCTSERETREIAERLERFRFGMLKMVQLKPAYEPPLVMVLFDDEKQMRSFQPLYKGKPKESAGVFSGGPDEAFMMLYANTDMAATMKTVAHEYVYFLLRSRGLALPTWLNEGFAELFAPMYVDDGRIEFGYGLNQHMKVLRGERLMPLERLFSVSLQSREYNEPEARHLFSAQAWLLTHFWMCGAEQDKAQRFLDFTNSIVNEDLATSEAFERAFGMDFGSMLQALDRYLNNGRFVVRTLKTELPDIRSSLSAQPVDDDERDMILSLLKWRMQKAEDSGLRLLQLAEKAPGNPRPYELLAMLEKGRNERVLANEYLQKAFDRGSKKPWVLFGLAEEIHRQLRPGLSLDYRMPEALCTQMRAWLDATLAAAPEHTKALEILAMVEAFAPSPRPEAINRFQQYVKRVEDRRRFVLMLSILRWRMKDEETSRKLLNALVSQPIPATRRPQLNPSKEVLQAVGDSVSVPLSRPGSPAVRSGRATMDQTLSLANQLLKRLDAPKRR